MGDNKPSKERVQFELLLDTAARAMVKAIMENPAHSRYIEESEILSLIEGMRSGFLRVDGNVVRLKGYEKRPYDLFTLNRELLTQLAAFIRLTTEYRYAPDDCKFEYNFMDICVFREGKPFIFVEAKVSERGTDLWFKKLTEQYAPKVASMIEERDRGNDELRKAKHIFKVRPEYLWIVTPKRRQSFRIVYFSSGFSLEPVADIPAVQ